MTTISEIDGEDGDGDVGNIRGGAPSGPFDPCSSTDPNLLDLPVDCEVTADDVINYILLPHLVLL